MLKFCVRFSWLSLFFSAREHNTYVIDLYNDICQNILYMEIKHWSRTRKEHFDFIERQSVARQQCLVAREPNCI